jgi:DNA-binding LacI/PurR family transcriptional regulator
VGPRTRDRVRRAAQALGYSPNVAARALRTGRTHAIGVAVRQLRSPFFAAVIEGIDTVCRAAGYHLLLGHVHSDQREEREIISLLSHGRTDGLLVLGEVPHDEQIIRAALAGGTPTVLVARPGTAGAPGVTCDPAEGLHLALDHLASLGHRTVALPVYPAARALPPSRARLAAARAHAAARGWPVPRALDAEAVEAGQIGEWLRDALAADPPLTAVLASDPLAVRVLKSAQAAGIAVPEQLSIVALDDTEITRYTTPELTAVTVPLVALGRTAAELLLRELAARQVERGDDVGALGGPEASGTPDGADVPSNGAATPAAAGTTLLAPAFTVRGSAARAPL